MNRKNLIIIAILLAIVFVGISLFRLPKPVSNYLLPQVSLNPDVKVETNCTDNIDNDEDGMVDSQDGDCWLREGAVFVEDFEPVRTFENLAEMSSQLRDIGIKTIEMLPIWDYASGNHFVRWGVRDYSKLDPERGTEGELLDFISEAHNSGLKIVAFPQITGTFAPSQVCQGRTIPGETVNSDKDGKGGFFYQYQMKNPDKEILSKNLKGEFTCLPPGYGFAVNQESKDVIELVENIYKEQVLKRDIDGIRLDASAINTCERNEKIFWMGKNYICPDPVLKKNTPLVLFRELAKIKGSANVFIAEIPYTGVLFSGYMTEYPFYPADPDIDEIADASEGYEFSYLLNYKVFAGMTSSEFVDWVNKQPIHYGRQRFRMIRNWNHIDISHMKFVAEDTRYYPAVTLASTISGIPKVTDYELFGNSAWDSIGKINPANSPESRRDHWKKLLFLRNSNNSLKYGDIKNIWKSGDNTFAYSRTYENETAIVVINFQGKAVISTLNLPFRRDTILSDELNKEEFTVSDPSNFKISVPAHGSRILMVK